MVSVEHYPLLAPDSVPITIKMTPISGVPCLYRRGSCGSGGGAIAERLPAALCRLYRLLGLRCLRAAVAVVLASLSIVMTALSVQTTAV